MQAKLKKGKYILAVSGGVDSMALLDMLRKDRRLELIVAHFEHGIRPSSASEADFVAQKVEAYGLSFIVGKASLGHGASEEQARKARYEFLHAAKAAYQAGGIVTAHHQDDLIETAILNLLRGTGPKGLTAILDNPEVQRPLINVPKSQIIKYARDHQLAWLEDESNDDLSYLRNRVRQSVMSTLPAAQRAEILDVISRFRKLNSEIEELSAQLSKAVMPGNATINRSAFGCLPASIGNQLMIDWLRTQGLADLDRKTIERLSLAVKTAKAGTSRDIKDGLKLKFTVKNAQIANTLHTA